jgi:hypothetical protein
MVNICGSKHVFRVYSGHFHESDKNDWALLYFEFEGSAMLTGDDSL